MLDCMYVEAMENMQRLPDYAKIFRGKPLRFVLPLNANNTTINKNTSIPATTTNGTKTETSKKYYKCDRKDETVYTKAQKPKTRSTSTAECQEPMNDAIKCGKNLIEMVGCEAEAYLLADEKVFCVPECLCDLGCETPRINYENQLGMFFKYLQQ